MVKKFNCKRCGNCCKKFHLGGELPETPCFIGGSAIMLNKPTLCIRSFERDMFPQENIVPCNVLFDTKNEQTIILDYGLNINYCPLLKENNCSVYDKRPISCRLFPCQIIIPNGTKTMTFPSTNFCKGELPLEELKKTLGIVQGEINSQTLRRNLYRRYGLTFINQFLTESFTGVILDYLFEFERENKIKLAKEGYNFKFLKKRIENSKKIDVRDLIKEYSGKDVDELFSDAVTNKAKEVFEENVSK